ncbi:heparin lyase I family protein [Streptomyces sp. NPDC019937]|uniref:heparin lyase I family protein n=1 Tax=Streptomyces sp. NPDC019937 TaxID=3154787 RepID=UPI0033CA2EC7
MLRKSSQKWLQVVCAAALVAGLALTGGSAEAGTRVEVSDQALPAGVYFQNEGTVEGWSNYPQKPQKQGVIRNVSTPAYKGGNAIEAKQTYIDEGGGYHSETIQGSTQAVGQDRYYGQAVYLAPTWQFHNQNVTFQQWSPEDPEGPWELMFIQNDDLRIGGSGGFSAHVAKVTNLRGTWIRIVTRLKFDAANGAIEIWVNGVKAYSKTGVPVLPKTSHTIRWSSGIYCTGWRENLPAGPRELSVFHDQARIANSYSLAEPANW